MKTAQIFIVGDEILSGRTTDTNSPFLAKVLAVRGVRVMGIGVIPDNEIIIAQWIREKHGLSDFLFVCGGIGGTPDDVTRSAVARACDVSLIRHPEAEERLLKYYGEKKNEERMSMADLPDGCTLIDNPVSQAPGFKIKNIYVFAGIPKVLHAMWANVEKSIQGTPLFEKEINLKVGEGEIARHMKQLNREFPLLELGSYPTFETHLGYKTQLVFKSTNEEIVRLAFDRFKELCGDLDAFA